METQGIDDNISYLALLGTVGGLLLASSVVFFFVRYQRRLIAQQAAMQKAELEHKQQILNSIISSQEEERIRISKDLHDHVGSTLSSLRFIVSRIGASANDPAAIRSISDETKGSIDRIIEDVRNISHSLSPAGLELWGFHEALEAYCDKTGNASGLNIITYDSTDGILKQLLFDDALSLFRVVQELVNNTIKHASAQNVTITISADDHCIYVRYADDGRGIDLKSDKGRGIGIYNIESRLGMINAEYDIVTAPGAGYTFNIRMPVLLLNRKTENV
jgi:signal transduction histidine kinase